MNADEPDEVSPALRAYLDLDARLTACRRGPRADTAGEAALLEEMEALWSRPLSHAERDWLEYRGVRRAAAERGGDNVDRKLAAAWPDAGQRDRARRELSRYGQEPAEREVERVQLAVLKLCAGHLETLPELVTAAKRDRGRVLARAEHPREVSAEWARRPDLGEEETGRLAELRHEDLREYWEWVRP